MIEPEQVKNIAYICAICMPLLILPLSVDSSMDIVRSFLLGFQIAAMLVATLMKT